MAMTSEDFNEAYLAITALEAQETMVLAKATSLPHMGKKAESVWKDLHKMAFPNLDRTGKPISMEDLARVLNGK